MYDFLWVERNGYPWEGAQNYLHECADPPANRYDPEGDGTYVSESLGVHEHCDPDVDIFSSDRYIGPLGNGIDYIYNSIENEPPEMPSDPDPSDDAIDVDINVDLSWSCSDPNGDNLTYDVYFEADDSTPDVLVSNNQPMSWYDPGTMEYNTQYYWQIIAWDEYGLSTEGSVWDFTTGSEANDPPNTPYNPLPTDSAIEIEIEADLSWNCNDPNGDSLTYDVYLDSVNPPINKVSDDQTETSFDPGILEDETTYYWQIIAKDEHGASTFGPIWYFITEKNDPPNEPLINGQLSGKPLVEYNYTFITTDPEGHDVYYWIEWDDGTVEQDDWIGPYKSDEIINISHSWSEKKIFIIKAKTKDIYGAESDFTELTVTIPRNKTFNFNVYLLEQLFEQFLKALQMLKYLIG
jgi:hypothetical protein